MLLFEQKTELNPIVFDVETTIFNKGHPFDPRNRLISYAFCDQNVRPDFAYWSDPDFQRKIREVLGPASLLVGFNIKFDCHWLGNMGLLNYSGAIWDCQLAEHILSGQQTPYLSLNEALESYGLPVKTDKVKEYWDLGISTEDIPVEILEEYNKWDVTMTYELYKAQRSIMTLEQVNLLLTEGEDMKSLIAAERAGFKWNRKKATDVKETMGMELQDIHSSLLGYLPPSFSNSPLVFNFDSGDQLSALLYGGTISYDWFTEENTQYKAGQKKGQDYVRRRWFTETVSFPRRFTPLQGTEVKKTRDLAASATHFYQVDDPTLQQLKSQKKENKELLQLLRKRSEKTKVVEMIDSVEKTMADKNWENDLIHGQYNQNVAVTGRLSSSSPNLQNTPPELDELLVSRYDGL
jgi:DNA polymerase I-like protein with 3'-5' exonuclease and polymerase domains